MEHDVDHEHDDRNPTGFGELIGRLSE